MTQALGYSHSLFKSGTNLRQYVLEVDKKVNNGNDNGLLDGDEIQKFKDLVQKKTGLVFDFTNLDQATKRKEPIQENDGTWIFKTGAEIAKKYKSANSKSTNWLNGKQPGKDIFIPRNKSLFIAYMTEQSFMKSKSAVDEQERQVKEALEKKATKENAELEKSKGNFITDIIDYFNKK